MEEREKLKSRLGFILLSAGCAIGIGNVWKFPYTAGQGGGGAFVLFYLLFLIILGLPIMTMEFAVGRASQKSPVKAYQALEKPGQKWHIHGIITLIGCYLLMMFYTTVTGWMLHYFYMTVTGQFQGLDADGVSGQFTTMLSKPLTMGFWMVVVVCAGVFVCSRGLQNGLEKVTKVMMTSLLIIMIILAVNSFFMDGAKEDLINAERLLRKYLVEYCFDDELGIVPISSINVSLLAGTDVNNQVLNRIKELFNKFYEETKKIITEHKDMVTEIAEKLLEQKILDEKEAYEIYDKYQSK